MTTQQLNKCDTTEVQTQACACTYQPATDIRETDAGLDLYLDMPGVAPDQATVTVEDGILTIEGKVDTEQTGAIVYRETRVGDYRRQFRVSDDVDVDRITAKVKDGVLTVHVPKPLKTEPKRIKITSA